MTNQHTDNAVAPDTILVPLDGSEIAEQALPYAVELAQRRSAELVLVSVVDIPAEFGSWSSASMVGMAREVDAWVIDTRHYLNTIKERFAQPAARTEVSIGAPATELRRIVGTFAHPLVVMTSHGRTGARRLLLGSVASKLVHDATCPVFVIRHGVATTAPDSVRLRRVLVPLDGSSFGETALRQSIAVFDGPLTFHLLRVAERPMLPTIGVPIDYGLVGEYVEAVEDEAQAYLQHLLEDLEAQGHTVTWEVIRGEPTVEILRVAAEQGVDVIAMATHGRGGFSRIVFGSVAEHVVHEATTPLLLIRPRG